MKGINFIEPLFYKVIIGEKEQTRRIMTPQPSDDGLHDHDKYPMSISPEYDMTGFWGEVEETGEMRKFKPRYRRGEVLYLKEPYVVAGGKHSDGIVAYKYNRNIVFPNEQNPKWENKLFMPEKHARYFIEITDVRAERLQDIRDEDCMKEGIIKTLTEKKRYFDDYIMQKPEDRFFYTYHSEESVYIRKTPQEAYADLIDKINGKGTWESNPFVWMYDFKLIKKK
jgi:hypothetical protein